MATNFLDTEGLKEVLNKISTWGTSKFQPKGNYEQQIGDIKTSLADSTTATKGSAMIGYDLGGIFPYTPSAVNVSSAGTPIAMTGGTTVRAQLAELVKYMYNSQVNLKNLAAADTTLVNNLKSTTSGKGAALVGYKATIGTSTVTTVWGALDALNAAVAGGLQFSVVDALPDVASARSNVIYMVKMADSTTDSDNYEEWIKVLKTVGSGSSAREEEAWERLGSTGSLKLTDYWAKADLVAMTTAQVDSLCDANLL